MSVNVPGFKSSPLFEQLKNGIESLPDSEKQAQLKKVINNSS